MESDEQWLINCLNASLDPNSQIRSFAETSLNEASLQPGFGAALCGVAANGGLALGLRQLAAVILKQLIKKHWHEDDECFQHPVISTQEKETIRRLLLTSLADPHKKICTAVSMAVASIAHYDWPEDWPDLLPCVLSLINDQTNVNAVHGALRCLSLLSSDMDDKMVPNLVPVLFPSLHRIVSSPQMYEKSLRSKGISIVYACTSMLGVMSGVYKSETSSLISPMLHPWIEQFSLILSHPMQSEDPDDWDMRMEVLKCLNQFAQCFPGLMETQLSVILPSLWQTFVSSLTIYQRSLIEGADDAFEGRYDSEGVERSLESFIIQLFEFLLTILGSPKLLKVIGSNAKEIVYYTIAFMQMTEQQVHSWSIDANQYVADEDDNTYSCRVSGSLLLEEVVNACGTEGVAAICDSVKRRFNESQQAKATGSTGWWRMREATLFALASVSERLLEAEESEVNKAGLSNILEQILAEDMATGLHDYPFLHARMFSAVAKFSSMINTSIMEHLLYAATRAIAMDVPPPVKVGACRAISQLLPDASKGIIQPNLIELFSSLTDLLNQASDETMHLVLETLQAAVVAGHESIAPVEPILSPIILNMWASHVSDPFISIDALEVLEAIRNAPGCFHPLASRVLPYVRPILNNPQQQPDGLVAGSLDLVTMLLKNAPTDIVKGVYEVTFDLVMRIILQTDDHSEMQVEMSIFTDSTLGFVNQNATQCLASMISGGKQDLLSWSADSGFIMRSLLDVASRLLDPEVESSGSLFVGNYILQLILHFPTQIAQHIRDLVAALIKRMQSAQTAGLRSSLVLIFARLIHMSSPQVEQFIDLLITIPAEGHQNSLTYLMSEWTRLQGEIQGAYQIKVTTTALALLLATRHIELEKINVQGHLIKSTAGITTRSRAKLAPDQWTSISVPAKILALLADALIEIQEQVIDEDDQECDWEEIQSGEVEADNDLLYSASSTSHGRPSYNYLDSLAKAFTEDQDDDYQDDLFCHADPLNEINMVHYIAQCIANFSRSHRQYFDQLLQNLTKAQCDATQMVLKQ